MTFIDAQCTVAYRCTHTTDTWHSPTLQIHSKEVDVHSIETELELVHWARGAARKVSTILVKEKHHAHFNDLGFQSRPWYLTRSSFRQEHESACCLPWILGQVPKIHCRSTFKFKNRSRNNIYQRICAYICKSTQKSIKCVMQDTLNAISDRVGDSEDESFLCVCQPDVHETRVLFQPCNSMSALSCKTCSKITWNLIILYLLTI